MNSIGCDNNNNNNNDSGTNRITYWLLFT